MAYSVTKTNLPDVLILEPAVFSDDRGAFFECFNARDFEIATGVARTFVQDNQSYSIKGVLRGLHYQIQRPQGKLIRVCRGEIFDVAVDIRRSSPGFGKWTGVLLSAQNKRQMWVPEGFAHGFKVLSDEADVLYKTTDYYSPEFERCIAWNDRAIGIDWPGDKNPKLSEKDLHGFNLDSAELFV